MSKWEYKWEELSPEAKRIVEAKCLRPDFVKGPQYLEQLKRGQNGLYVFFHRPTRVGVLQPSIGFNA
jgi:hypothetical protein